MGLEMESFLPNLSLLSLFGSRQHSKASIFIILSQHTYGDATSLRDLIKDTQLVEESRKRRKKHQVGFEPTTSRLRDLCFTAVL